MSSGEKPTPLAQHFLQPANPTHRQYEALRAYFVEGLPAAQVAARFGYTYASFRALAHQFRQDPDRPFFLTPPTGLTPPPRKTVSATRSSLSASRTSPSLSVSQPATPTSCPCDVRHP